MKINKLLESKNTLKESKDTFSVRFNTRNGAILKSMSKSFDNYKDALNYAKNEDEDLGWAIEKNGECVTTGGYGGRNKYHTSWRPNQKSIKEEYGDIEDWDDTDDYDFEAEYNHALEEVTDQLDNYGEEEAAEYLYMNNHIYHGYKDKIAKELGIESEYRKWTTPESISINEDMSRDDMLKAITTATSHRQLRSVYDKDSLDKYVYECGADSIEELDTAEIKEFYNKIRDYLRKYEADMPFNLLDMFDLIDDNGNLKESIETLWQKGNQSIIKDGYGFGIDNGYNVNRFTIDNAGNVRYDNPPSKTMKAIVDRLVRQGKFNNPNYSDNAKFVGNTLKYGRGVEESFEKEGGPFWYFTKHGLGPGMLPKGVNVVDTVEDDNFGTYIALDKVLSTRELKDYELRERKPNMKEDVSYEWKPNTSFKHIKDIYEKVKANGYKYVNNEREEFMAAVKKADAKGYKPEQRRQIRDWHRDIWAHNRKTESYEGNYSDKFRNLIKKYEDEGTSPSGILNDIIRYCPEDALKDLWFDRGYARDFDMDELTEASSESVEGKPQYDVKKGEWVEYNICAKPGVKHIIPVEVAEDLGTEFYGWAWGEGYHKYQKSRIVGRIDMTDVDEIKKKYANKRVAESVTPSSIDFDDDTDGLSYYYDDELFNDNLENSPYTEIASKSVPDFDGFMTDYTMYMNINTGEYVFILGDKDIYTPEDGNFDWECETEEEAREWFDSYNGFEDDMDEAYEVDKVWGAVCSNRQDYMRKGLESGRIDPNVRYHKFGRDHSYIMGALRNNNKDMVKLLQDNGGTILDDERDEFDSRMNESAEQESPIIHKKSDGSYLIAASNGDGYVAFNKSDVCMGNISANNEVEAKNKFNANKFDE
jgi:hypothetical protein